MSDTKTKREARIRRHTRVRRKVSGTAQRPRLAVYRSNRHIYAQLIDDATGRTLVSASDADADVTPAATADAGKTDAGNTHAGKTDAGKTDAGKADAGKTDAGKIDAAKAVGALIARRAKQAGIESVVFDRGGRLYHGRVAALAEAAREGGLSI
jgi:large subunit ribosomal protein L18